MFQSTFQAPASQQNNQHFEPENKVQAFILGLPILGPIAKQQLIQQQETSRRNQQQSSSRQQGSDNRHAASPSQQHGYNPRQEVAIPQWQQPRVEAAPWQQQEDVRRTPSERFNGLRSVLAGIVVIVSTSVFITATFVTKNDYYVFRRMVQFPGLAIIYIAGITAIAAGLLKIEICIYSSGGCSLFALIPASCNFGWLIYLQIKESDLMQHVTMLMGMSGIAILPLLYTLQLCYEALFMRQPTSTVQPEQGENSIFANNTPPVTVTGTQGIFSNTTPSVPPPSYESAAATY